MSNTRFQTLSVALKKLQAKGLAKAGQSDLVDTTFYINVDLSGRGGGRIELVDANTKRLVGITNFDGNKLNAGKDIVVDSVKLIQSAGTPATIQAADFTTTPSTICKELGLSELKWEQQGRMLVDLPATELSAKENIFPKFRPIATAPIVTALREFNIYLEIPQNVTIPAGTIARLEVRAIQAKR